MTIRAQMTAAALFWGAIFLVQNLNWGAGASKAAVLLALLIGALWLVHRAAPPPARANPSRALVACAGFLLLAQLIYFGLRIAHPHLIDMATTTLEAGRAMIQGQNPYNLPIDTEAAGLGASPEFQGYKYLPLMPAVYLPLGSALGARGVLATNLLLLLATLGLMLRLGRDAASPRAGLIAALLYLSIPLAAQQVLVKGSTDLAAVVPLLLGFSILERRPGWAGFCVGLSISAKLFPGALFLPCLLPASWPERRRYGLGVALGLLPILPYALLSPAALYDNIVLFNAIRAPDSTSWLSTVPSAALAARAAFIALFLGVTAYIAWRAPGLAARCGLGAALALGVILAGPAAHHNYQLWWLPFYCVSLAAAL
jgi:Glycosyltransferase family 87